MQTKGRIFDDIARVANGAITTLAGIKGEIDAVVRQRIERLLAEADLVPRDEFDAVKAMAANARAGQEALRKRIDDLEARLAGATPKKSKAKPKPAAAVNAKAKPKAKPKASAKKRAAPKKRAGLRKPAKKS
jgi:BMFP domain-containing protein YqiC